MPLAVNFINFNKAFDSIHKVAVKDSKDVEHMESQKIHQYIFTALYRIPDVVGLL